MVAEEFKKQLAAKGVTVNVHHIREVKPKELPLADLYVFSLHGRMGKPLGTARSFIKKVKLPSRTNVCHHYYPGCILARQEEWKDTHRRGTGQVARANNPHAERKVTREGHGQRSRSYDSCE